MTRRIAIAILVCVWSAILVAGLAAYFATRAVLLRELDARLVARASSLPEVASLGLAVPEQEDRYLIRGRSGQTIRTPPTADPSARPQVLAAQFATLGDGRAYRSLTLRFAKPGETEGLTIVYSGPADGFNAVMSRLAIWLGLLGIAGSLAATAIAIAVSRAVLRPLRRVAGVIGQIDDRNLSRRVDLDLLPDELIFVGRRLNDMLTRLEQHAAQRQQFLANASHELRTPVAALLTTLQVHLTRQQSDAPALRRALEHCLGDARMLKTLVDHLMHQVRSESTAFPVTEEVDLVQLLRDCVNVAEGLALEKQIAIETDWPETLFIHSQPEQLRRVCLNLLSNAVSYNVEKGRIAVVLAPDGSDVMLRVSDTGIGISSDDLPNVFNPFFRGDRAHTPNDHLGLGLFQVQSDVQALHGQCRIESALNQGTTVTVRLPNTTVHSGATKSPIKWSGPYLVQN